MVMSNRPVRIITAPSRMRLIVIPLFRASMLPCESARFLTTFMLR